MKRLLFFCSLVALLWVPFGATAQDQDRTRDRDRTAEQDLTPDQDRTRLQIRDELRSDRTVTEPELAALDPEIASYAKRKGEPKEIRETVRESVRAGCKGACLTEAVRSMNTVMARGETAAKARERVVAAVHEQARERSGVSDAERGERVRERVEAQERERAHERTQTHGPAGTGKGPR